MRENGFYPVQLKKYKPGRQERSEGRYCKNIVKQQFRPGRMNEIWAGDITYLKTKLGWAYLAVVMDLYNREVIGYAVSRKMNAELVCRALMNAVARNRKPKLWFSIATEEVNTAAGWFSSCWKNTGSKAA